MKRKISGLIALTLAGLMILTGCSAAGNTAATAAAAGNAAQEQKTAEPADEPAGPIIEPQAIADYIFEHGELPDNFITKKEAQALGWDSKADRYSGRKYVSDVAPGKSIGGDWFGNYEGLLPRAPGRTWRECDIDTLHARSRGAKRIIWSNDGLIYYTGDHYESFTLLYGEE